MNSMNYKYHYVVFGGEVDYFKQMFQDAVSQLDVEYISNPISNAGNNHLVCMAFNLHHNDYVNSVFNLPFKSLWYSKYYTKKNIKPVCFVFMMDWCKDTFIPLFKSLRERYTDSKLVLYLEDIIESRPFFNIDLFNLFDSVISFDKNDAVKYNIRYYPTFMSKYKAPSDGLTDSDACFWGAEKNRKEVICSVFNVLENNGLKCDFFVSQVKDKNFYPKKINTSRHGKSYYNYLESVLNTKIIVEILQDNAVGYTLRTWESLIYGKILLTNNKSLIDAPFYNPAQMIVFSDPNSINITELKGGLGREFKFDSETISPIQFFSFLEKVIY